jgi:hypothetical protein
MVCVGSTDIFIPKERNWIEEIMVLRKSKVRLGNSMDLDLLSLLVCPRSTGLGVPIFWACDGGYSTSSL